MHDRLHSEKNVVAKSVLLSIVSTLIVGGLLLYYFPGQIPERQRGVNQQVTTAENIQSQQNTESIPDIVERATPAVVSVVISADVPIIEQYFEEYNPFGQFFGGGFGFQVPRQREVGTEKREIGGGTGFFVSPDGFIVTNRHVVATDGADYSIVTNDGATHEVEVVARDPQLDIAILKVTDSGDQFEYLNFGDSDSLRLGSQVIAIGNALAEFPNSVSVGVVSGLSRDIVAGDRTGFIESLEGVIQTDAAINQGNSGGPLLNTNGEVIGVNVAVAGNGENIGFALPSASVSNVYKSVQEHGEIVRPFVGIRYIQIDERVADANNLDIDYGILIIRGDTREELAVIPGSAADKAGLVENDIILKVNGKKLDGSQSFASMIRNFDIGDTITLTLLHDGEENEVQITLEEAPQQ